MNYSNTAAPTSTILHSFISKKNKFLKKKELAE
jgi:hypothetical protein